MYTEIAVADAAAERTADERWADWVARGVESNKKSRKRMTVVAAAALGGVVLWLATALLRG